MGVPYAYPLFLVLLVALTVFSSVRAAVSARTPGVWIALALGAWLAAIVFMTVRPGTGLGVRLNLIPFVVDGPGSAFDAVRNLFVFVPFGMLLAVLGWRLLKSFAVALAVSLSIEITQYFTNWGRTADVNDLLTNVAGATLGWTLASMIRSVVSRRRRTAVVEPVETKPPQTQPVETEPRVY